MTYPEENPDSQQEKRETKKDSANTLTPVGTKQKYEACKAYARRYYEKICNRPWWFKEKEPVAKFTGWVAIFTLLLALVAGLQTCILSNQLQELKDENRPWIYVENALPASSLAISESDVSLSLEFHLNNTGRFPSRFTSIAGEFFYFHGTAASALRDDILQKLFVSVPACRQRRRTPFPGTAVFPQQRIRIKQPFAMDKTSISEWKNLKAGEIGAIIIAGCVDYLFPTGGTHHQTQFVYEIQKGAPGNSFLPIPFAPGEVPAPNIWVLFNPSIPKDAD